ncbi:MAG: copper-binding protein [Alteromonadaceae bacterium]|jgi:putative copper resistance protein D|uniref:copper resistance D family protein n=1 Tax=Rheinheimera aquimaris TaxID=412437 RepID=UPI000C3C2697|nr:CopD family protein [Rheinheimera aquimaris]MBJ92755.1 copper-binding protein [Alteromonadaceae bacterium]MCD1599091.1 CopD family protein [Rheinheimera aquimaris]HBN88622.1 copper-binding protein [Rheinheimera sp.]|tara:strand:+ start:1454 stop:2368 length:915 start_codon:yes stop_codon:yes gene_type:complete
MFSDAWVLALFAHKLASYLAVSGSIGAAFLLLLPALAQRQSKPQIQQQSDNLAFRQWLKRLVLGWSAVGMLLALLYLPLQAGALAEAGIAGMADSLMLQMVWQSAMRTQLLLLLCGFATLSLWAWRVKHSNKVVSITLVSIAALLLAASFSQTGHVASLAGLWPLLLTLHVLAISAWVGALLPLWQSCYRLAPDRLLALMQQFGRVAVIVVLVLISCGVLILLQLLDSPAALFVTDYGRLMLLKLMLVAAMLLLAAWHKFNLVKALAKHQNSRLLARSIFIEMLLALLVLVTCSSFTTVVGLAR